MKKLVAVIISLALLFTLAACTPKPSDSSISCTKKAPVKGAVFIRRKHKTRFRYL